MPLTTNIKIFRLPAGLRAIGMYTFSNFFSKAAGFLLLFVFTNPFYITPGENGVLSLFSNGILFLMPFLSMGIIHAASADFFRLSKKDFQDVFTSGFVLPVVMMVISIAAIFVFRDSLQARFGIPSNFLLLIPVIAFLTFCNEQLLSLARNSDQPGIYVKANVFKTIIELGLSAFLVVFLAWRWQGRVAGMFISYLAIGVYAFYYFKKNRYIFGKIKKQLLRKELLYAFPVILMQGSIFCMSASDRFFLASFTNDHAATVGIYSIASTFALVINVFSMAMLQYIFPKIYSLLSKSGDNREQIKKHFKGYLSAMITALLLLMLLTPWAYKTFIHERYAVALQYQFMLCIGFFFWGISYFFYSFLLYHKDKRRLLIISSASTVLSLGCNYYFISHWQAPGAAFSVMLVYAIVLVLSIWISKPYWKKTASSSLFSNV
ncbi:MAG: oligosaccharide flippase family protein [Ferruginibacter sp.]